MFSFLAGAAGLATGLITGIVGSSFTGKSGTKAKFGFRFVGVVCGDEIGGMGVVVEVVDEVDDEATGMASGFVGDDAAAAASVDSALLDAGFNAQTSGGVVHWDGGGVSGAGGRRGSSLIGTESR